MTLFRGTISMEAYLSRMRIWIFWGVFILDNIHMLGGSRALLAR